MQPLDRKANFCSQGLVGQDGQFVVTSSKCTIEKIFSIFIWFTRILKTCDTNKAISRNLCSFVHLYIFAL
jgi:hypothetical protein